MNITKGELRNELISHFLIHHNIKVFVASFEESNAKTYKLVAGKVASKIFHDPERDFDFKAYDIAGEKIKDKLMLLNLYQHAEWKSLREDIIQAVNEGAKAVFLDPITNLTDGVSSAEANTLLQSITQDLAAMALDMDFLALMFCHLKAPDGHISGEQRDKFYREEKYIGLGNCDHEWGGNVYSNQFTGSRSMMRKCNFLIGLEGNKDPALPDHIRNIRNLKLLEDREFGESGVFPVYWSKDTGRFIEL